MIISLEGSRGSGKTYILEDLKNILPKGTTYFPNAKQYEWIKKNSPSLAQSYSEARYAEDWFFKIIADRFAESSQNNIAFFERDYLSSLSFSYAYSRFSDIDTFPELFDIYNMNISKGTFKKPDVRIILDNNYDLFKERNKDKDTKRQDIWFEPVFANHLFEYYRLFAKEIEPTNSILMPLDVNSRDVADIILESIKKNI